MKRHRLQFLFAASLIAALSAGPGLARAQKSSPPAGLGPVTAGAPAPLRYLPSAIPGVQMAVVNPDGAWCWFQDERALCFRDQLAAVSITRMGRMEVNSVNVADNTVRTAVLRPKFDRDDHNVPGLLLRQDGYLMAFYTLHHRELRMCQRTSARPFDATAWNPEKSYDAGIKSQSVNHDYFTYANPFQLSGEKGRIYNFWRGLRYNPTFSRSDDLGHSWSAGRNLIFTHDDTRPYVKYASDGRGTIHFFFTEAHPGTSESVSIYHAFYRKARIYRSDGTPIKTLDEAPIRPEEATRIFDGSTKTLGNAWCWDAALDPAGRPVVVFASLPTLSDMRYRYARWNGKAWEERQIAFAGKYITARQSHYSGGICLDPDDVNVVYASSNVDIASGRPTRSGIFEIYRGVTADGGRSWAWSPLTRDSAANNLRPIVPPAHKDPVCVLWFRGRYTTYTDFQTEVVLARGKPEAAKPPADY